MNDVIFKYKDIISKDFNEGLRKLNSSEGIDSKIKYRILRISKKIKSFAKDADEIHKKLNDKNADKDKNGNLILIGEKKDRVKLKEGCADSHQKEYEDILEIECESNRKKINHKDIEGANLSVNHLMALEFMIDFPEDEELVKEKKKESEK